MCHAKGEDAKTAAAAAAAALYFEWSVGGWCSGALRCVCVCVCVHCAAGQRIHARARVSPAVAAGAAEEDEQAAEEAGCVSWREGSVQQERRQHERATHWCHVDPGRLSIAVEAATSFTTSAVTAEGRWAVRGGSDRGRCAEGGGRRQCRCSEPERAAWRMVCVCVCVCVYARQWSTGRQANRCEPPGS